VQVTLEDEIDRVDRKLSTAMAARPRDTAACITALENAVALVRAEPEAAEAFVPAELLDLLAEEYERAGRFDDALAAMREAIDAGRRGQPDGRCRLAEILMRSGRAADARPIWAQVKAETPDDVWLHNNAGLEYSAIGEHETALEWLTDGLRLALNTGDPERLVDQLVDLRAESLTALGREPDQLQVRGRNHLAAETGAASTPSWLHPPTPTRGTEPMAVAWAWFPATEYAQALRRWPGLAEPGGPAAGGRDHAAYCRAMHAKLVEAAEAGMTSVHIAPIRIRPYLAWCAEHGHDPGDARATYAADLARTHPEQLIAWPPARNAPCWCGSGRKHKRCCAAARGR